MAKVRTASSGRFEAARKTPAKTKPAPKQANTQAEALSFPAWVWIAVLAIAPLAVFFQVLRFPFVSWDDTTLVSNNPWMHPVTWASFVHSWHYPLENLYAPLTHNLYELLVLVSHMLHPGQGNALSPSVFHAASLLLHIGCAWTVFALLRRLGSPGYASFLGALLFAVHPLAAEPVSWIGGMDTVLSTFLCLLALWQYAIYAQDDTLRAMRGIRLGAASLCYLLALFAKPGAVSLPIMALVLELFVFRRTPRAFGLPILAWIILAIAWVHVTRTTQHVPASLEIPYWQRPFIAGDALAFYLMKLFWPFPITIDYGRNPSMVLGHAWGYCTWLLPAVAALIAWRLYRSFPQLAAGFGLMIAGTLPVLGFVPFVFQGGSTVSDRYMYLAMIGPALALAGLAARMRPAALYSLFGVLLVAGVGCHMATEVWRSSEALYQNSLALSPDNAVVRDKMGDVYLQKREFGKAATEYRAAAELAPTQGLYSYNLAIAYAEDGDIEGAIGSYRQAVAQAPGYVKAHFGLGLVYAETGQTALAAQQWRIAVQLSPGNSDYHYNLGLAELRLGRYEDSAREFRIVLVLEPNSDAARYWLGRALSNERPDTAPR